MVISASPLFPLFTALALLLWPSPHGAGARLTALLPAVPRPKPAVRLRRSQFLGLALVAAIPLLGPAGVLAAGLLGAAVWCHRRVSRRAKADVAAAEAMAEAIRVMIAELRAGAPPALAAEAAAADSAGRAAATMGMLAGTARLGGDPPTPDPAGAPDQRALATAWSLSRRHGVPLADLLDAVRRDILAAVRFATRVNAGMSGPRASAAVLAALPSLGLLLGEAMGAGGLHVLVGTPAGQVLLVIGSALILLGVAWSARLTSPGAFR
ncbi:MAG TPA: hypothetical protein VJT49_09520 [Amycolatopsis sp.]|nr:hypothetical protein [Amycolatopsis sp.]